MPLDYLSLLKTELNSHINHEKDRVFKISSLLNSQNKLRRILSQEIFSSKKRKKATRFSVVGSNGKGSTAFSLALLANIKGKEIGLFTSPHLISVCERIRINSIKSIPPKKAWQLLEELKAQLHKTIDKTEYASLSYFEILTILACYIFHKHNCAIEIYEAGLGGRFDATRSINAENTVLTLIDKEHTEILGKHPKDILKEKLGILNKDSRTLFCMPQTQVNNEDIKELAYKIAPQITIYFYPADDESHEANSHRKSGNYIQENQKFAAFILKKMKIPFNDTKLLNIPGRLEKHTIHSKGIKEVIFDTAHNPSAITRTLGDLVHTYKVDGETAASYTQKSLVILAVLANRPVAPMHDAIKKAGFQLTKQLTGDKWAKATSGLGIITEANLIYKLLKNLKEDKLNRVIFLGTHRSYSIFLDLVALAKS